MFTKRSHILKQTNIFGHFSSKRPLKDFSDLILLKYLESSIDSSIAKKSFQKIIYNRRRITLSKA